MKAKSRFLGIDDAPFRFSDETVPVVGVVVQAPSYIEGVLTTLAEVDGHEIESIRTDHGTLWVTYVGAKQDYVRDALSLTTVRGVLPEPLRVAHLIAAGIVRGESHGRA